MNLLKFQLNALLSIKVSGSPCVDTQDKRSNLKTSYSNGIIKRDSVKGQGEIKVTYIPCKEMPADVLTKRGPTGHVMQSILCLSCIELSLPVWWSVDKSDLVKLSK